LILKSPETWRNFFKHKYYNKLLRPKLKYGFVWFKVKNTIVGKRTLENHTTHRKPLMKKKTSTVLSLEKERKKLDYFHQIFRRISNRICYCMFDPSSKMIFPRMESLYLNSLIYQKSSNSSKLKEDSFFSFFFGSEHTWKKIPKPLKTFRDEESNFYCWTQLEINTIR